MKIFDQEKLDGLESAIKASASFSYASLVAPASVSEKTNINKHFKSLASLQDPDLYYVQSILVTSSWNKNDDIFDKSEVWEARNTPEDKPTNLEHDEASIIGHITANWPITEEGILIDENTPINNLPEKYHILTGSVIYRGFSRPELKEREEKLITEVEMGEKYVSMECFFKGFDYGLLNKETGEFKVLARNNNTAFLTKHLRAYGGMGEHENYKIGRVLRNITFSGKGFVAKPANPDSIIFTKDNLLNKNDINSLEKKDDFSISGVSNNQSNLNKVVENSTMNSENTETVENQVEANDCSQQASELQTQTVELAEAIKAKEAELEQVKAELGNTIQEINDALAKKEEDMKKKDEEMMKKEEEMKKMKAELDAATETIAAYKQKEEEMMKKEKKMKRVAELLEKGIDNEVAVSTVDKFEALDDATFESITSLLAGVAVKKQEAVAEEVIEDKKSVSEEVVDVSVLETAEPEATTDLSVGQEDIETGVSSTRAALVDFVYSRLGTITK